MHNQSELEKSRREAIEEFLGVLRLLDCRVRGSCGPPEGNPQDGSEKPKEGAQVQSAPKLVDPIHRPSSGLSKRIRQAALGERGGIQGQLGSYEVAQRST